MVYSPLRNPRGQHPPPPEASRGRPRFFSGQGSPRHCPCEKHCLPSARSASRKARERRTCEGFIGCSALFRQPTAGDNCAGFGAEDFPCGSTEMKRKERQSLAMALIFANFPHFEAAQRSDGCLAVQASLVSVVCRVALVGRVLRERLLRKHFMAQPKIKA